MGLDITFHERLTKVDVKLNEDGEPIGHETDWAFYDSHTNVFINPDFPTRADGMQGGFHKSEGETEDLRIGYSSYSQWRSELALAALGAPAMQVWEGEITEGPFVELINFSDCEGTIGPRTSAKLAKDFADWEDKIEGMVSGGTRDYFMEKFRKFKAGFELAKDSGAATFH